MLKPCCRSLDIQAVKRRALVTLLPEVYDLEAIQEYNDWHTDDVFQQSLRLLQWVEELPISLLYQVSGNDLVLQRSLLTPVDTECGHHTLKDMLRFAAIIHDVGKKTLLKRRDDQTTFCPEHEIAGAELTPTICNRFDFTLVESYHITTLVRSHGEPYTLFKQLALTTDYQQEQIDRFEIEHTDHLLPLLLLACGDLVTSQLQANRPEKYAAVLDFYHHWIRRALQKKSRQMENSGGQHESDPC